MSAPHEPPTPREPSAPPTVPPPQPDDPPARSVSPGDGPEVAGPGAPPAAVPDLDDRERELDPRVVTLWRISTTTALLVPGVVLSVAALVVLGTPFGAVVPAVVLVLLVAGAVWYPRARYDRWRWRLTDLAVELERGVVVRQAEALPYFRIQQIDVTQGPIDRLLGLASLQVTSASASGSVTLPGIAAEQAPGIRRVLVARAAAAVGEHETGVRDAV